MMRRINPPCLSEMLSENHKSARKIKESDTIIELYNGQVKGSVWQVFRFIAKFVRIIAVLFHYLFLLNIRTAHI